MMLILRVDGYLRSLRCPAGARTGADSSSHRATARAVDHSILPPLRFNFLNLIFAILDVIYFQAQAICALG